MKRFMLIAAGLLQAGLLQAQYQQAPNTALPGFSAVSAMEWCDFNLDRMPDLLVAGIPDSTQVSGLYLIPNHTDIAEKVLTLGTPELLAPAPDASRLLIADYNLDGQFDVVALGKEDGQLGLLVPGDSALLPLAENLFAEQAAWGDFDNDGRPDLAVIARDRATNLPLPLVILYNRYEGFVPELAGTDSLAHGQLTLSDFNNDGLLDLAVAGQFADGQYACQVLIQQDHGGFRPETVFQERRVLALHAFDLDHNGFDDLVASSEDASGEDGHTGYWLNVGGKGRFKGPNLLAGMRAKAIWAADLNRDGLTDVFLQDAMPDSVSSTICFYQDTAGQFLPHEEPTGNAQVLAFGDPKAYGSLDIAAWKDGALGYYEMANPFHNNAPFIPTDPLAIAIHGRVLFTWQTGGDTETPIPALTYDVLVKYRGGRNVAMPSFQDPSPVRLRAHAGNAGHNTFFLIKDDLEGDIDWAVQPVDNRLTNLVSSNNGGDGTCRGSNILHACVNIDLDELAACPGEELRLSVPEGEGAALWFSMRRGFLGTARSVSFTASASDTVFYAMPRDGECALARSWAVEVAEVPNADEAGRALNRRVVVLVAE